MKSKSQVFAKQIPVIIGVDHTRHRQVLQRHRLRLLSEGEANNNPEIETNTRQFIEKKDYVGAYRYIFSAYADINESLVENVDYYVAKELMPENSREAFLTDPNQKYIDQNGYGAKPTTHINPKIFKDFASGKKSFGVLVRSIYHESVHIRLIYGRQNGFSGSIYPKGEMTFASELVAYYMMVKNNSLPAFRKPEVCNYLMTGLNYYNSMTRPELKTAFKPLKDFLLKKISEQ